MQRSPLVLIILVIAVAFGASPASAKEDVEATLHTRIPVDASPGDQLDISWTLASIDDQGKRVPFGAGGVFVQLFSASGGKSTIGFASGDGSSTGRYWATVVVLEGGIVLEGLQQLEQYQQNWTTHRSTCERLKHEKFLFLCGAGPYGAIPNPESLLTERVEGLVSQEHAAWVSHRDEGNERIGGRG